jgi:aspartate aminotransferase
LLKTPLKPNNEDRVNIMFQSLNSLPADPILGLMATYRADSNPLKVDLGIGVYKDEKGNTTVMTAVKKAEDFLLKNQTTKTYIGPTGAADYNSAVAELLLGAPLNTSLCKRPAAAAACVWQRSLLKAQIQMPLSG